LPLGIKYLNKTINLVNKDKKMTDIDVSIVKKTQEILGKFVKRPQLTEKLLLRPPFRFIHDIVTMVSYFCTLKKRILVRYGLWIFP
jgi:hypothetical protein